MPAETVLPCSLREGRYSPQNDPKCGGRSWQEVVLATYPRLRERAGDAEPGDGDGADRAWLALVRNPTSRWYRPVVLRVVDC